jgi:hypothetical protein
MKDVEHWMVSWGGETTIDVTTFKSKSGFPIWKIIAYQIEMWAMQEGNSWTKRKPLPTRIV